VSEFDLIIGQEKALGILNAFLGKATIPHALVFSGLAGTGKMAAATAFAMACNCRAARPGVASREAHAPAGSVALPACGHCRPCKKIKSANHPDILHLSPTGETIKVKQIRDLLATLALKPFEAQTRVVIIQDAQTLNPAAGNALLKALEEPPADTLLILTTGELSDLMPTIVSRCQHVRFRPLAQAVIAKALVATGKISSVDAALAARLSGGSLARAEHLADADWMHYRRWLLEQTAALTSATPGILLALAAIIAGRKAWLPDTIAILKTWFRDLLVFKHAPDKLINRDMQALVQQAARLETAESLLKKLNALDTVSRRLTGSANIRLCLEALLLKLART